MADAPAGLVAAALASFKVIAMFLASFSLVMAVVGLGAPLCKALFLISFVRFFVAVKVFLFLISFVRSFVRFPRFRSWFPKKIPGPTEGWYVVWTLILSRIQFVREIFGLDKPAPTEPRPPRQKLRQT